MASLGQHCKYKYKCLFFAPFAPKWRFMHMFALVFGTEQYGLETSPSHPQHILCEGTTFTYPPAHGLCVASRVFPEGPVGAKVQT